MDEETLMQMFKALMPHLDERQKRLVLAAQAEAIGRGGIAMVSRAAGVSRPTIYNGRKELKEEQILTGRVRKQGGGRKQIKDKNPDLVHALDSLLDPDTRGDPMSPLRWTSKSTRQLASALNDQGYQLSHVVVSRLLHEGGYSLQANTKVLEGTNHPDRDQQFHYINKKVKNLLSKGVPVISVDCKKKELIGQFKNNGREWHPKGIPEKVRVHDFPDPNHGKAIPFGIYDIGRNEGWVNVGRDHETSVFAVESIRRWWFTMGAQAYPKADQVLICADAGGSNGYRRRLWKVELQRFADENGLKVTVCHFPPGTSKWNKIEHRLFSHITMNWRGRPLTSHEVIVELIGSTKTNGGLRVKAGLDKCEYPTKIKVSDEQMANIQIKPHKFHGEWNYTISPTNSK
jgi:transposase